MLAYGTILQRNAFIMGLHEAFSGGEQARPARRNFFMPLFMYLPKFSHKSRNRTFSKVGSKCFRFPFSLEAMQNLGKYIKFAQKLVVEIALSTVRTSGNFTTATRGFRDSDATLRDLSENDEIRCYCWLKLGTLLKLQRASTQT